MWTVIKGGGVNLNETLKSKNHIELSQTKKPPSDLPPHLFKNGVVARWVGETNIKEGFVGSG